MVYASRNETFLLLFVSWSATSQKSRASPVSVVSKIVVNFYQKYINRN